MPTHHRCRPPRVRVAAALGVAALLVLSPAAGASGDSGAAPKAQATSEDDWRWPFAGPRTVVEPYRAPAHAYGPGHRGIDIAPDEDGTVRAPADGVVAFRGVVVDRPLLTIDHGGGLVSSFEPMVSTLDPGTAVAEGDALGTLDVGGHTARGTLHVGVRQDGTYINPMVLFGGVPRAILLPCGADGC